MKLLVIAQTPPPLHGQSLMVQTMLDGLRRRGDFEIHHVNLALSNDSKDIGRFRLGKILATHRASRQARRLLRTHGPMPLYYVPAPGKRGALFRDWLVMSKCRPHASSLILHWHACGLGDWLQTHATRIERSLTHRLLGQADLSIVLASKLADDTRQLSPRRTAVVANGIADPGTFARRLARAADAPCELLYLGLCTESKGIFDLLAALKLALKNHPHGYRLTVAGGFASVGDEMFFRAEAQRLGPALRYVGFADEKTKHALLAEADAFVFPTHYPHEGQPLVLLEALAHDLPIIATRWRAIPEMLPTSDRVWLVAPQAPSALVEALESARTAPAPDGLHRQHYLAHYTTERHLDTLSAALLLAASPQPQPAASLR